jgi:hypothetical protein
LEPDKNTVTGLHTKGNGAQITIANIAITKIINRLFYKEIVNETDYSDYKTVQA